MSNCEDSFPEDLAIQPTENTQDQPGDIDTYGLAGVTWHAALLLQDYATTALSCYDPPFHSLLLPGRNVILDIGSGTSHAPLALAQRLSKTDHVILSDLPEVVPLMSHRIAAAAAAAHTSCHLSACALPWGSRAAVQELLHHSRPTLVTASDLVYFRELFAPLLRTLLWLTDGERPPTVMLGYKTRAMVREEQFWKAFGHWFDFYPVLINTDQDQWTTAHNDEVYLFLATRRKSTLGLEQPQDDDKLLGLTDDTFERILFSSLDLG